MGSTGASVLKILQNASASVSLVTQLIGSSVVFSVVISDSTKFGLLCRERQTGSDHRCHQWHWAGGGRRARRTRRERRHPRSQQGQDAHCLGSHHGGRRGGADTGGPPPPPPLLTPPSH